jgi:DNA-binding XRE family transcriptional regulator
MATKPRQKRRRRVRSRGALPLQRATRPLPKSFRELRDSKGLTQEQLASRAGVCLKTISRAEKYQHDLQMRTVLRFARALDVDSQWLFACFERWRSELKGAA